MRRRYPPRDRRGSEQASLAERFVARVPPDSRTGVEVGTRGCPASAAVWRVTAEGAAVEGVMTDVGRGVTGAGVSICAPIILI